MRGRMPAVLALSVVLVLAAAACSKSGSASDSESAKQITLASGEPPRALRCVALTPGHPIRLLLVLSGVTARFLRWLRRRHLGRFRLLTTVGHINDNGVRPAEDRGTQPTRRLVVEDALPPAPRHVLRDDDEGGRGEFVTRPFAVHHVQVGEQGPDQCAEL